ncbi:ribonuclease P protein subunit p14 isoform X2 [Engraulis encrasicolus]|uniref:ribonuclease P protein subunit p14 isoform X2 n=1 Tax=Engraulis encrasicolus TaxID=184585 RepID=UPI002FD5080C
MRHCLSGKVLPVSGGHVQLTKQLLENGWRTIDAAQFKQIIISGLKPLYGEVGVAIPFDLLKFDPCTLTGMLRVGSSGLVKLWSAITLVGSYQNELCALRVTQISPFLISLSGNSRELDLH